MKYKIVFTFSILLIFFLTQTALPDMSLIFDFDGKLESSGVSSPWRLKEKSGKANVKVTSEDGERVIYLRSEDASFSIEREVKFNVKDYPYISWKWKALRLPPRGDLRRSKANDQALQVLIAFEGRKIISYIWDSNAPEGTLTDESIGWPVSLKIKVLAVKSGTMDTGKWLTVTRNIYDDYKMLFGEEPTYIKGIRLQTNSQHTESIGEGYFGKILFSKSAVLKNKF